MNGTRPIDKVSLGKLRDLVSRARVHGFFVSQTLHDELMRVLPSAFGEATFASIPIAVDPSLDAKEIDVAFSVKAWRERLAQIARLA